MSLNLCQIHLLYFFLSSVFISMHGFIQAFWLHVITLYSFFNTIPWFDAVFNTAQKMKFFIKGFFSKCDQICSFLRIWWHFLKKSLMENFIFCAVLIMDFLMNLIIDRFADKCNISFFSKIVRQLMTLEFDPILGSSNVNWIHKQQCK